MHLLDRTTVLLVANGAVLAAYTHLARFAGMAGVPPLTFALALSGGAALLLLGLGLARGQVSAPNRALVRYGVIAGLLSVALPQGLIFTAAPHIGGGIAAVAYAFPPLITYAIAVPLRMEPMSWLRTGGLLVACLGGVALALARSSSVGGQALWIALAMSAPLVIAVGNIFRVRAWPPGANPFDLALGMALGAGAWLVPGIAAMRIFSVGGGVLPANGTGYLYLLTVALVAAVGWILYFELQKIASIVTFSQMGYVGAALGLVAGALFLGERYSAGVWAAVAVIVLGIVIAEWAKRRRARRQPTAASLTTP